MTNKISEGQDKTNMQRAFDKRLRDATDVVKTSLGSEVEDDEVKGIAARLATESSGKETPFNPVVQYHSDRNGENPFNIHDIKWQYVNATYPDGKVDIGVYRYGHDMVYDYEWFMKNVANNVGSVDELVEDVPVGGVDKYADYRLLVQQMSSEGDDIKRFDEADGGGDDSVQTNDPVKLKNDVARLMSKLDMSSIEPYLAKIDNPTEQAEVIAQFAERIGVPKGKLSSVISQLKMVAEDIKMTKGKLIETVTGKKVIRTIKVKDINNGL